MWIKCTELSVASSSLETTTRKGRGTRGEKEWTAKWGTHLVFVTVTSPAPITSCSQMTLCYCMKTTYYLEVWQIKNETMNKGNLNMHLFWKGKKAPIALFHKNGAKTNTALFPLAISETEEKWLGKKESFSKWSAPIESTTAFKFWKKAN